MAFEKKEVCLKRALRLYLQQVGERIRLVFVARYLEFSTGHATHDSSLQPLIRLTCGSSGYM